MAITVEALDRFDPAVPEAAAWRRLRSSLWPHAGDRDHDRDSALMVREENVVLLARENGGDVIGFAEICRRDHANGCETSPVAYLEGIYVSPVHRNRKISTMLIEAAEAWASERGYAELASDVVLDNAASRAAHAHWGFSEVHQVACYRKSVEDR